SSYCPPRDPLHRASWSLANAEIPWTTHFPARERTRLRTDRPYKQEVGGSIPSPPTRNRLGVGQDLPNEARGAGPCRAPGRSAFGCRQRTRPSFNTTRLRLQTCGRSDDALNRSALAARLSQGG